jgi:hypothetical protein
MFERAETRSDRPHNNAAIATLQSKFQSTELI